MGCDSRSATLDDDLALLELKRQGQAILLVEQNVAQALVIYVRGYVLDQGRIALTGTGAASWRGPR